MSNSHVSEPFTAALDAFSRDFVEDTRLEARDALAHIVAMHDRYPDAMLPTPLLAAIEAGRKVL